MVHSDSESGASASSVASIATQPHLPPPQPQPVVFTIPNMNPNLHIKLSKETLWRGKYRLSPTSKDRTPMAFLTAHLSLLLKRFRILQLMLEPLPQLSTHNFLCGTSVIR
jgi:hypothetical protein